MLVEFECDCGHQFRTNQENVGKPIVCPNCMATMTVPLVSIRELSSRNGASKKDRPSEQSRAKVPNSSSTHQSSPSRNASAKSSKKSPEAQDRQPKGKVQFDDFNSNDSEDVLENLPPLEAPRRRIRRAVASQSPSPGDSVKKKRTAKPEAQGDQNKKKSGDGPPKGNQNAAILIIGSVVGCLAFLGLAGVFVGPPLIKAIKEGGKIKVPQELEQFRTDDFHFTCKYPKGWEPVWGGGAANIPPSVRFEKGRIKISFRASQSGTLIGDIAQSTTGQQGELPDELKPVARVHDYQKDKFSHEMTNYIERGAPEKIETGMGEARLSTFVASGDFGGTIFGYRATLLANQYQWNGVCQCSSEREFKAYKELFKKIIESAGR